MIDPAHYRQIPQSPCQIMDCPLTTRCAAERIACEKFYAWVSVASQNPKLSHWEHKSGEPESSYYQLLYSE